MADQENQDDGSEKDKAVDKTVDAASTPPARPEALTSDYDQFWDDKEGVKFGALVDEVATLRNFKAEADVRATGIPEKPEAYKVELPAGFEAPEGAGVVIDDSHPLAGPAKAWAHKHGVTQEAFAELIGIQAQGVLADQKSFNDAAAAERAKLGANAQERIDALSRTLEGRIGKDATAALNSALFTAASVDAMEKLIRGTSPRVTASRESAKETTQKDWGGLSGAERFANKDNWNRGDQVKDELNQMPVDANFQKAVPLIEYGKLFGEGTGERAFIDTFTETSDLWAAFPMKSAGPGGKHKFFRTAELPDVKNRAYNEPGNVSHGRTTKFEEGVFLMDEYIRVDRALVDELGNAERARQEHLKAVAIAQHSSRILLKGDNRAEPREASGFQARATRESINLFHNSTASGGAALSLLNLDTLLNSVNAATHIIAPYSMRPLFQAAARSPTLTNSAIMMGQEDLLGRKVQMTYNGYPILWGYEPDDSPPLLDFTEVGKGGGAAVTASIYAVSLGDGKLFGIEGVPLTVRDEGQIQGVPVYSTHLKWDWGIVEEHPRSLARLTSITKAALVA